MTSITTICRRTAAAAGLATALTLAPMTGASAAPGHEHASLPQLRQATVQFQSTQAANDAGYFPFLPCFDDPNLGGMGQHFANFGLLDGVTDDLHPEILVYSIRPDGTYKLVAVEYVVPGDAWHSSDPPQALGRNMHFLPNLGVWALHAWIWQANTAGLYADYNPGVKSCPSS